MTKIISKETLKAEALARRIAKLESINAASSPREVLQARDAMLESLHTGAIPTAKALGEGSMHNVLRRANDPGVVAEFIGTADIQAQWFERQRYEVEAGRDEEPLLYPAVYSVVTDMNLPRAINIYSMGPAGVVLELVTEGGQVKYATINTREKAVTLQHYAVGLEYTDDLFEFNELWRLANIERQFGIAANALFNHVHMDPILSATYTGSSATDGTALTTFLKTASMPEKYMRTLESAIATASSDKTNPRRGPYALLINSADQFTVERVLGRVPQQGFDAQSSARTAVQSAVVYDGWTGVRGSKETTYNGVGSGVAYLISLSHRAEDFQSFFKYPLRRIQMPGDPSRFIAARDRWDTWFGVYASPARAVHKITWPVATSGQALT